MIGNLPLSFSYQNESFRVRNSGKVKRWILEVATELGFQVDSIGFVFCDDDYLLTLNITHLRHNTYTDVITFDYGKDNLISGEIYISFERLKANSKKFNVKFRDELHRVIIHGILHLCGWQDSNHILKAEMTEKENYCLSLRTF
jgi:rRNA maturation RNase YbeY